VIKNYTLDEWAVYKYEVQDVKAQLDAGSINGSFYIENADGTGRVPIKGMDSPDCDWGTEQLLATATSDYTVNKGQRLVFSIPAAASAADLAMTVRTKRV